MKNITVCDRDEKVLKPDDKSYKLSIQAMGASGKVWEQELDLCEECMGQAIRGIAQRVFLDDSKEGVILEKVGCPSGSKRSYKRFGRGLDKVKVPRKPRVKRGAVEAPKEPPSIPEALKGAVVSAEGSALGLSMEQAALDLR